MLIHHAGSGKAVGRINTKAHAVAWNPKYGMPRPAWADNGTSPVLCLPENLPDLRCHKANNTP